MNLNVITYNEDLTIQNQTTQPIRAYAEQANTIEIKAPVSGLSTAFAIVQGLANSVPNPRLRATERLFMTPLAKEGDYSRWNFVIPGAVLNDMSLMKCTGVRVLVEFWYIEGDCLGVEKYNLEEGIAAKLATDYPAATDGQFVRVIDTETDWYYDDATSTWIDSEDTYQVGLTKAPATAVAFGLERGIYTGLPSHAPTNTELILEELKKMLRFDGSRAMTGDLDMDTKDIKDVTEISLYNALGNAVISFDGTNIDITIGGVDYYYAIKNADNTFSELNTFVKQITAQAGMNASNQKIINLADGANPAEAVNKGQLDAGLLLKENLANKVTSIGATATDDEYASAKAAYTAIKSLFKDVSYAAATGILTFTLFDDTTKTVDLPLELLIESGSYDADNNQIVLVLADSSVINIPVGDLLTDLDAVNVRYDNATSGLTADKVQAAIDEIVATVNALIASGVPYDNTDSNLAATNVKSALDELDSEKIDKDFSGYDELAAEDIVDDDYIVIRDVSTNTTKKTKVSTINNYIGDTYEYGVRRVYAPTMQTSSVLERVMKVNGELIVGAATGLEFNVGIDDQVVTNSFDNIDIFQFEEVVINGNDFIKFPKRFTKHEYVVDGATTYEYWWQCAKKLTGYSSVVFDRYGTGESDYAYIGKYKMVDIGGVGKSAAGYYPDNSLNMDAARTKARKNDGDGTNTNSKYGLVDRAERYELMEVPFYIITATLHSQSVLVGVTNLTFDTNTVADSTINNTAIVANASATLFKTDMCIYLSTDSKYHVITAIDVDTPAAGQTTITFDGDTVLPLTGANLDPRAYKTGLTTGVRASFGAYRANTGYDPITILGLEDIYGGMWEGVDGVKVNDWYPFFNTDPSTYSNAASIGGLYANYTKADFQMPNANGYSKDMGFDDRFSNLPMPIEVGGNNATYYADYFYQASGDRVVLVGGFWGYTSYAGMTLWVVCYTLTTTAFSIGFRLSYRP